MSSASAEAMLPRRSRAPSGKRERMHELALHVGCHLKSTVVELDGAHSKAMRIEPTTIQPYRLKQPRVQVDAKLATGPFQEAHREPRGTRTEGTNGISHVRCVAPAEALASHAVLHMQRKLNAEQRQYARIQGWSLHR